MDSRPIADLTIAEAARLFRLGNLSPIELTQHYLERINALNPRINAFVTITRERALEDAERATRELAAGQDLGPLHGIPISFKDNIDTAGIRTTVGSLYYRDRIPADDA